MLLKTRGRPHLIEEPIIGVVTRDGTINADNYILIVEGKLCVSNISSFAAIITNLGREALRLDKPSVYSVGTFDHLADGDVIVINKDGIINTLYRIHSRQNFLLATERCNSNCLMCSQPPKDRDDTSYLYEVNSKLIPLIPKDCEELGITGGEPTLMGERFFRLLELIKFELPDTEAHCLTNGRSFAWKNLAARLERIGFDRLMLGIPLYSDYPNVHDYIVQSKDAYHQTMQGLYNLASINQRIEIRVVLHQQSIPRLVKLAKFITMNLPFVEHVAFMGLEYQGYTPFNHEKLWIDPAEYMNELWEACDILSLAGMSVSVYNSQLCLMPQKLWRYNKRSISDWKNIYLDKCKSCIMIKECGGLFASCESKHSNLLKPFLETEVMR
jgi:His-Xaa-Ser system radical SAM maturase HxsC